MGVSPITVGPADIAGWPQAVTMGNGLVTLTLVPEAARILTFDFGGRNLFYVNPDEYGRVHSPSSQDEWHNFGGTRFDVAPQGRWKETPWKREWPPPPVLNSPRLGAVEGDGFHFVTPLTRNVFDLSVRVFMRLIPGSTKVSIVHTIENVGKSSSRWANWIVSQLAAEQGASVAYIPGAPNSAFENGYVVQMEAEGRKAPLGRDAKGGAVEAMYDGAQWKFGFDKRDWIAFRPSRGDNLVFILMGRYEGGMEYPDGGSSVEYYSAAHLPYVELELLGPLARLSPNKTRSDEYSFAAANCPGKIVGVSPVGVVGERLSVSNGVIRGAFGVFYQGTARLVSIMSDNSENIINEFPVSPNEALVIEGVGEEYGKYRVDVHDRSGKLQGVLDFLNLEGRK